MLSSELGNFSNQIAWDRLAERELHRTSALFVAGQFGSKSGMACWRSIQAHMMGECPKIKEWLFVQLVRWHAVGNAFDTLGHGH